MKNNCIVDVLIGYVESLFGIWYVNYSYYLHFGHGLMNINCHTHSFF